MKYTIIDSPIGPLLVARDREGITTLLLPNGSTGPRRQVPDPRWVRADAAFDDARTQLGEYFDGTRTSFELPLHLIGSPFQLRAWRALLDIPYGETRSYGQQTAAIGAPPTAARAVGSANGQNPIPIIVPCHRVIGANGSLIGYGGGLPTKQQLLALEASHSGLFAS
jgi:O-6-methylguanine DNA methyltransferase